MLGKAASLATLSFFSASVFAWGTFGHQTIALLAERHLCAAAHTAVLNGLSGESMADASHWADDVRTDPQYSQIRPWHFVDMPLGSNYSQAPAHGDVVTAIKAQQDFLKSSDPATLKEALRLVIHFVGDAHQPYHAGTHDDAGANAVNVTWFGAPTNLHHVWDTEMLYQIGLSAPDLAVDLDSRHYAVPAQLTPEAWVTESSALAKRNYPSTGTSTLGQDYYNSHVDVARQRLWQAAMRLAALLNSQYGCN